MLHSTEINLNWRAAWLLCQLIQDSFGIELWKLVLALNNCPLWFPILVFLVVWFFRGSRGLVTCWAGEGGRHLNRQACHLLSCPSALTAPDQAPPVARQHISMYHCLARRLLSLSSSCSSTASLSTFLGGKEVLTVANHRRFASTGSVRDSFISFVSFNSWVPIMNYPDNLISVTESQPCQARCSSLGMLSQTFPQVRNFLPID